MPRHIRIDILRLLRPAESAARRLIVIAARDLGLPPVRPRKPWLNPRIWGRNALGKPVRLDPVYRQIIKARQAARPARPATHSFPLLDHLPDPTKRRPRRARHSVPRISQPGVFDRQPVPPKPKPDDMVDATRIGLRLDALTKVLADLPAHARRYVRWTARRDRARAANRRHRQSVLKPGRPPGWKPEKRRSTRHPVFECLDEAHGLALWSMERRDSS